MSRYKVFLEPNAEDGLAAVWLDSADPTSTTSNSDAIDRLLQDDPLAVGEHVKEGLYRITYLSLVYYYSVDEKRRIVIVSAVGTIAS